MVPAPAIATIDVPAGEQVALAAAAVGDALTGPRAARADGRCRDGRRRPDGPPRAGVRRLAPRPTGCASDGRRARRWRRRRPAGAAAGLYARRRPDPLRAPRSPRRTATHVEPRLGLRLTDAGLGGARGRPGRVRRRHRLLAQHRRRRRSACCPPRRGSTRPRSTGSTGSSASSSQHALRAGLQRRRRARVPRVRDVRRRRRRAPGLPRGRPARRPRAGDGRRVRPVFCVRAADLGMKVFLRTDMLALTPPLEALPRADGRRARHRRPRALGGLPGGPRRAVRGMPFVDGLMVRIGEGGAVYERRLGLLLRARGHHASTPCGRCSTRAAGDRPSAADRDVIFRTWSVGVGAVGDMHTNPRRRTRRCSAASTPRT